MLFNKIKSKYHENLLNKFMATGDTQEIIKILHNLKKETDPKKNLTLKSAIDQLVQKEKFSNVFKKNLIWVHSYNMDDCAYLNKFLSFIFTQNNVLFKEAKPYGNYLSEISLSDISFEELIQYSYFYQYIISELTDANIIINNSGAFFETIEKRYFTHYFLSKFYFYLIKNPLTIYKERKALNPNNDTSENMFGLTSSDMNYSYKTKFNNNSIEENKHNWSTNVLSWTNSNVISTFKGYIINYEKLLNDPQQILAEIVAHIIQCGLKINLDYQQIQLFLDQNPIENKNYENFEISNKELKILSRDNYHIGKKFGYFI